jgi:hypothetical protein
MNTLKLDNWPLMEIAGSHPEVIRTNSGKYINLLSPHEDDIDINDIVHSLCNLQRFNGHLNEPFSVAHHCLHVSWRVDKEHQLAALLHDASEAYIADIPSPLKKLLPEYKRIEHNMMKVIAKKFGFKYPFHEQVLKADQDQLLYEWDIFVKGKTESDYHIELISATDSLVNALGVKNTFMNMFDNINS